MSESQNGEFRPSPEGERVRRRQYRITARLLKEYTARLHEIAGALGDFFAAEEHTTTDPTFMQAFRAAARYKAVGAEVAGLALAASQMLVHYDLGEGESAELSLRIADTECAIRLVEVAVKLLAEDYPEAFARLFPRDDSATAPRRPTAIKK